MAYNPFMMFRKNQKAIMAGLVIFTMFIFVISSGAGGADLFHQIADWMGGRSGRPGGGAIASIDGKRVDPQAVELTRAKRRMASEYVSQLSSLSFNHIVGSALTRLDKLDQMLQTCLMEWDALQRNSGSMTLGEYLPRLTRVRNGIYRARLALEIGAATDPNKKDQMATADDLVRAIDHQMGRLQKDPRASYFGGGLESTDDIVDFLVWKNEADRLGVRLDRAEVNQAVAMETLNQRFAKDEQNQLNEMMRRSFGANFTVDRLNEALLDEFRVRAAKAAIAGETAHGPAVVPVATPDELYEWYKDVRTTVRVGLIDVPVERFLAKVTEQPTEDQLKELFEKYKADEASPYLDRPGFKEPRMVKVEWFRVPLDSDYYRKLADQIMPVLRAMRQFEVPLSAEGTAAFALGMLTNAQPAMIDVRKTEAYQDYVSLLPSWRDSLAWGQRTGLHDTSVLRPENFAGLLGAAAGDSVMPIGPLAALLNFEGDALAREFRDRARLGATAILSAAIDPAPFGIDALAMKLTPPTLTEDKLAGFIAEKARTKFARELLSNETETFRAEVVKRTKEQNINDVGAFVNECIHSHKFERGGTAMAIDRFAMANDPSLAPLREVFKRAIAAQPEFGGDPTGDVFAMFASGTSSGAEKPQLYRITPLVGDTMAYFVWQSETVDPQRLTFEQAKPKVEAAWRWLKARDLAKTDADRLAAEAKAKAGDVQQLRDLALQQDPRGLIEIGPLSQLKRKENVATGGQAAYEGPSIPADRVHYPGDMAIKLVDLRKQSIGATEVVSDQGKQHYYTAVLLEKDVPSVDLFRMAYKNSMSPPMLRDPIFEYFANERRAKYQQEVVKQLRADAHVEIFKDAKKEPVETE